MLLHSVSIGFLSCAALIVAIGAQNAFILRQGLRGAHVRDLVIFAIAADAALISLGVAGAGAAIEGRPELLFAARWAGAVFVAGYGVRALWRARRPGGLAAVAPAGLSRLRALVVLAALTFLNPHVYLDTLLLLGTLGASQPAGGQVGFVIGAVAASALWFVMLGAGSRLFARRLADPRTWRWIDAVVGVVMLVLAVGIARG